MRALGDIVWCQRHQANHELERYDYHTKMFVMSCGCEVDPWSGKQPMTKNEKIKAAKAVGDFANQAGNDLFLLVAVGALIALMVGMLVMLAAL